MQPPTKSKGKQEESGFSLIELLLVFVIVGLLATIAIPSLLKSRDTAEKAAAVGMMHTLHVNEMGFFSHKGRYGTLAELNAYSNNKLGTLAGSTLLRGNYSYFIFPSVPSSLRTQYTILGVRYRDGRAISAFLMNQNGEITTLIN